MQLLLRKSTVNSQGQSEFSDIELGADSIAIGSAPDCGLQLLGAQIRARHAVIRSHAGGARVEAERGCEFEHNGARVGRAALTVGDTLAFGDHRLTVLAPPRGFDLALEWHPGAADGRYLATAYRTSLGETRLRPRALAWVLALAVLLLAGALPLASYFLRQHAEPAAIAPLPVALATADSFWSSGPLHTAHRAALGDRCESCHAKPFEAVQDSTCQSCHKNAMAHVPAPHPDHAKFDGLRCASCHQEHEEPSTLVVRQDSLCVDCHRDRNTPVRGFAADQHPAFRLSLLQPDVRKMQDSFALSWSRARVPAAPGLQENSHLKFSHQLHLNGDKVRPQGGGAALQCGSCHTLSADREHFEPITMEKSCSSCHDLSFDPSRPQQQLPHGDAAAVYEVLEAHFISRAFGLERRSEAPQRRRPGHDTAGEACKNDAACAKAQAEREAVRQFTQRGCVTCHAVETFASSDPRMRWQVLPVRLTGDWFPAARFNHQVHLRQGNAQGDAACVTCHQAETSQSSSDILMPALDTCLQCHGDAHAQQKFPLQCVSCHAYHPAAAADKDPNHAAL